MNNNFLILCAVWIEQKKCNFDHQNKKIDKIEQEYKFKPKKDPIVSKKNTRKTCKKF
jgi:hypothetical protein